MADIDLTAAADEAVGGGNAGRPTHSPVAVAATTVAATASATSTTAFAPTAADLSVAAATSGLPLSPSPPPTAAVAAAATELEKRPVTARMHIARAVLPAHAHEIRSSLASEEALMF